MIFLHHKTWSRKIKVTGILFSKSDSYIKVMIRAQTIKCLSISTVKLAMVTAIAFAITTSSGAAFLF